MEKKRESKIQELRKGSYLLFTTFATTIPLLPIITTTTIVTTITTVIISIPKHLYNS